MVSARHLDGANEATACAVDAKFAVARVLGGHRDAELEAIVTRLLERLARGDDPDLEAARLGARLDFLGMRPSSAVQLLASLRPALGAGDPTLLERAMSVATDALCAGREQELERLARLVTRDPLTGLPNRRAFLEALEHAEARARRGGHGLAVAVVGLDALEHVAVRAGEGLVDELLAEFARLLAGSIRASDVLARIGRDTFALLGDVVSAATAPGALLARIEAVLAAPRLAREGLCASIGVAITTERPQRASGLIEDAQAALHTARSLPEDGTAVRIAVAPAPELASRPSQAPSQLPRLDVVYQPIVDLATGTTKRVEALSRLEVDGARCSFDALVASLGRGERVALHRQSLERVLADIDRLGTHAAVNLNVDADLLNDESLIEDLTAALAHLARGQLRLEITERSMLLTAHLATVRHLREHGASISLDDFGTGYASLSRLLATPLDEIKLERTILGRPSIGELSHILVAIAVALARALRVDLVVEGIDSLARAGTLLALGVTTGQGYALGPPLPSLEEALAHRVEADAIARAASPGDLATTRAWIWRQALGCLVSADPLAADGSCAVAPMLDETARRAHLAYHRLLAAVLRDDGVIDLRRLDASQVATLSSLRGDVEG